MNTHCTVFIKSFSLFSNLRIYLGDINVYRTPQKNYTYVDLYILYVRYTDLTTNWWNGKFYGLDGFYC